MKCIHHNDTDGRAAARAVAVFEKDMNPGDYIEVSYSDEIPYNKIAKNEKVYLVDYCIPEDKKEILDKVLSITKDLIWVDHHHSSLEMLSENPKYKKIKGYRQENICGACLTEMWLESLTFDDLPMYLKLISDYDCWQFRYGTDTSYLKCALDSEDTAPTSGFWKSLENDRADHHLDTLLDKGEVLYRYQTQVNLDYKKRNAYEVTYYNYKMLVMNGEGNSWMFGKDLNKYDFCVLWIFNGDAYKYSLYSSSETEKPVNVSDIAKKYGGGGYVHAAGFISKKRVW